MTLSRRTGAALFLLLVVFAVRLGDTIVEKSLTADEPGYMGTGLYLWATGDYHWYRSLRIHPPLAYHLASLPLLALDRTGLEPSPELGFELLRRADPPPERVRILSRLPFAVLAVWGALLCFLFAREVAGDAAGLLAAFLYTFSPNILAHGSLVGTDLPVSVFFLQGVYTFWRWQKRPGAARLVACGVSIGLALASKMNGVLLPVGLASVAVVLVLRPGGSAAAETSARHRAANMAIAFGALGALAAAVLLLAYGGTPAFQAGPPGPEAAVPAWIRALLFDNDLNQTDRRIYFLGTLYRTAPFIVLPATLFWKVPLGAWILAVAAALAKSEAARRARLALVLGLPAVIYAGVACFWLRLPMGVRYLLPLLPLLHVWIGACLVPLATRRRRAVVAVAGLWIAAASLWIHPHYLAYFNEAIGGPAEASHYTAESNLDWGQDLGTLARFLAERGNPRIHLAYFGVESPERYGIRSARIASCAPVSGWVAVSVNDLVGLYNPRDLFAAPVPGCFDWLREHEPVARPGYSIFVYDLTNR